MVEHILTINSKEYIFPEIIQNKDRFQRFSLYNITKLKDKLSKIKEESSSFNFFERNKKMHYFLMLKHNQEVLQAHSGILQSKKQILKLESLINSFKETIKNKHIEINICILSYSDSNEFKVIDKLFSEFCRLKEYTKDEPQLKDYFEYGINYTFSILPKIIGLSIAFLILNVISKINDIGILIDFIAINTLTTMINILLNHLFTFLGIIIFYMLIAFTVITLTLYYFKINECFKWNNFKMTTKLAIVTISILFIPATVFLDFLPKSNTYETIRMPIIEAYLSVVNEPIIRNIKIGQNKFEPILLIGKDQSYIYYLKKERIKKFISYNISICDSKKTNNQQIFELLTTKDNNKNYILSNKMYLAKPIKNVEFEDAYIDFKSSFCENKK